MRQHAVTRWTLPIMFTIMAASILAAGIIILDWSVRKANPPPANPQSSLPTSAPVRHSHCNRMPNDITVPSHSIIIPPRDIHRLTLILQEFAHQQGGCYHTRYPNQHRLTLPQPAIDQILLLNRRNYAEWATGPKATPEGELRHIDLQITVTGRTNIWWVAMIGLVATITGIIGGIFALVSVVEMARAMPAGRPLADKPEPSREATEPSPIGRERHG